MRSVIVGFLGTFFCVGMALSAESPSGSLVKVAPKGETSVQAISGKSQALVKIATSELDIGKPSDKRPKRVFSNCTYSRFPCSPVDHMEITVNGRSLFVARSVYADLTDLSGARLTKKEDCFVLTLDGGDASESYSVEVTFDENAVRKRRLLSTEAEQVMQETTYFFPEPMN